MCAQIFMRNNFFAQKFCAQSSVRNCSVHRQKRTLIVRSNLRNAKRGKFKKLRKIEMENFCTFRFFGSLLFRIFIGEFLYFIMLKFYWSLNTWATDCMSQCLEFLEFYVRRGGNRRKPRGPMAADRLMDGHHFVYLRVHRFGASIGRLCDTEFHVSCLASGCLGRFSLCNCVRFIGGNVSCITISNIWRNPSAVRTLFWIKFFWLIVFTVLFESFHWFYFFLYSLPHPGFIDDFFSEPF